MEFSRRKKLFICVGILILIIAVLSVIGINQSKKNVLADKQNQVIQSPPVAANFYKVNRVVDGDTIKVQIGATEETVRLIGINTPETVDPRKPVECFGIEASNRAKSALSNKNVRLESDNSQDDRDKYGRLLRYVYLEDGSLFNQAMIQDGYAYEYTYQIPYKFQREFKLAQSSAEAAKRGLWADDACAEEQSSTKTATPPATKHPSPTIPPSSCSIKGNINSKGEKIYHVPGCGSYNATVIDESKGEHWFCTEEEALNSGWRKALNCPN